MIWCSSLQNNELTYEKMRANDHMRSLCPARLRLITLSGILILLAVCSVYSPTAQATNSPLHVDLSTSLGFIFGQRLRLSFIEDEFPSLSLRANMARRKFDLSFGVAEKNIKKALKSMYGDKYDEIVSQIKNSAETTLLTLNPEQRSREFAEVFLGEVESRAEGKIPSPILETLLHYQFEDNPADEYLQGFRVTYRTKDHPKSKRLDFQIEHPRSWFSREGKRPNVIQFFKSNNGKGLVYASIMTRDLVEEARGKLTDEEIKALKSLKGSEQLASEIFTEGSLREMANDMSMSNVRNIETNRIILDGWPGTVLSFVGNSQRVDVTFTMYNQIYMVIYKNYMILLHFHVMKLPETTDADMETKIAKVLPLFHVIANSLVIQSQY